MQATDRLPPGRPHCWWCNRQDSLVYCVIGRGDLSGLQIVRLKLPSGQFESFPVATVRAGSRAVCAHAGALFVVYRDSVEVFDPETGERRHSLRLRADVHWVRDRFFRAADGWYGLSFDGLTARLEQVFAGDANYHVFDCAHWGGPVAVMSDGNIVIPGKPSPVKVPHGLPTPVWMSAVSHDGNRLVLSSIHGRDAGVQRPNCLVRLQPKIEAKQWHLNPASMVDPPVRALAQRALRVRIQAISVSKLHLVLMTSKGKWLRFEWSPSPPHFAFKPCATTENLDAMCRTFRRMPSPPGVGYKLCCAEWTDGSRVVLDSRGLLHLQSSDPEIPECTLVLFDHDVAGWCADGRIWGSEYFNGLHVRPTPADEILKSVILPFVSRLE